MTQNRIHDVILTECHLTGFFQLGVMSFFYFFVAQDFLESSCKEHFVWPVAFTHYANQSTYQIERLSYFCWWTNVSLEYGTPVTVVHHSNHVTKCRRYILVPFSVQNRLSYLKNMSVQNYIRNVYQHKTHIKDNIQQLMLFFFKWKSHRIRLKIFVKTVREREYKDSITASKLFIKQKVY